MIAWFVKRVVGLFVRPSRAWKTAKEERVEPSVLFRSYAIPLVALLFLSNLFVILSPGFHMPRPIGILLNVLISASVLFTMHAVCVIVETVCRSVGGTCTRETAMKLSYFSSTPAILFLALLPVLRNFSVFGFPLPLIGFPWSLLLYIGGANTLLTMPPGSKLRYLASTVLLSIACLLLVNLFIIGIINMILGPQQ